MVKSDIARKLKEELPNDVQSQAAADRIVNQIFDMIRDTVASNEDVTITGFGTFTTSKHNAHTGRNPQTGESIQVPAKTVPRFKAGKQFKDSVA